MLLASRIGWAGVVFILLTTWISGPPQTLAAPAANLSHEDPTTVPENNVQRMQQLLIDKGNYTGKVDGLVGLRTRASIRAYQKAEHLPVTGRLDAQTAGKLGVGPELVRGTLQGNGGVVEQQKPSAGIPWGSKGL